MADLKSAILIKSCIVPYSETKKVSISELVEQYFYSISKPTRHQNIIDTVEN